MLKIGHSYAIRVTGTIKGKLHLVKLSIFESKIDDRCEHNMLSNDLQSFLLVFHIVYVCLEHTVLQSKAIYTNLLKILVEKTTKFTIYIYIYIYRR